MFFVLVCVYALYWRVFDMYLFEKLCMLKCLWVRARVNTAMHRNTKCLMHPILDAFCVSMHILYVCISLAFICQFQQLCRCLCMPACLSAAMHGGIKCLMDPPSGAFCVSVSILTCIFDMYQFEQLCMLKCLCMHACVNAAMHGDTKLIMHPILDAFCVSLSVNELY